MNWERWASSQAQPILWPEVDGIQLTSRDLMALTARPENSKWLAASCHNLEQLQHAQNIGVDFVVLAPVLPTQPHPGAAALGWEQFADLVAKVNLPVYALGGMTESSLITVRQSGGQGDKPRFLDLSEINEL